ncbi:putative chemotaxis signal transduction protein CheW [Actinoplanes missouriensis 431]|uniref:Chemotaxis protein CheW n=1 Tax=Actinoplanes missouriensis (strain ATCC 14538 / DSM 43046 / CBS 188.64 / JCM 3121 / NBRC 102363 / NCIMB 12654 / NRRL B-3342 / UNCC 431) TaxID=512565 RepID=I0HGF9_ACTM4|nr:chemotaxis protein CheW [Actinoplanes missouriensis]BAL92096.1 putative chemotaxis signal transduction protein CheW [Actinoplanes missouriensis 431]
MDTDEELGADELDDENTDYVTFDMAGERYAFPMHRVQEIIRMPAVVKVPLGPPSLEGLANLRGRVLPVVNLRGCCSMEQAPHDETTRVIVVDGGVPLGFVVDRVASVISIDPQALEPAESVQSTVRSDVLVGVIKSDDGDMTTVLHVDNLIGSQFSRLSERGSRDTAATARVPGESDGDAESDDTLELVSFAVEGQEYALPIEQVQEIVQAPESVSHVPNAGSRVLGVIDLRGRLLPVVSMRRVFGLPVTPLAPQNRIVVVSIDGGVVGVVMDTVREVLRVPHQLVAPLPNVVEGEGRKSEVESVCRLEDGKRLVSVLSVNRMFDSPEVRNEIADYRDENEEMAVERDRSEADDGRGDEELFVVFRLDDEEYAVDVDTVQEIIRVPEALIRVPKSFDFVEGLVNLRGTVLPVVDLRTRLGLGRTERDERQRIVVLIIGGVRTGFIVDSVAEVARVGRNVLEPAPELSAEQARVVSRVANLPDQQRMLLLVQVDQLLAAEQADQAAELCEAIVDEALVGV